MGRSKNKTVTQNLEEIVKNKKKVIFVKWYVDNTEHSKNKFENDIKNLVQCEFDTCIGWLEEEKVQNAIKIYMKQQQTKKIVEMFNVQYQKAVDGDIKAAEFVVKFYQDDFFNTNVKTEMEQEADNILSKIDIPLFQE